jgi:YNFM family putative membrane transporter
LRLGQQRVLWASVLVTALGVLVSQSDRLPWFVVGLCLMTVGFFAMHAVCSGWVGLVAPEASKAQATALYLLAYYIGSSVLGYLGGWAWDHGGWLGLSGGLIAALLAFTVLFRGAGASAADGGARPGPRPLRV